MSWESVLGLAAVGIGWMVFVKNAEAGKMIVLVVIALAALHIRDLLIRGAM